MHVSKEELQSLTRARYAPKVKRVLQSWKVAFRLDDNGFPVVLRTSLEVSFSGEKQRGAHAPNVSALQERLDAQAARKGSRTAGTCISGAG